MTKERAQEQKGGLMWPEWRLYANFLHRELARLWYGKKSVFSTAKGSKKHKKIWDLFGFIWGMLVGKFGEAHGIAIEEAIRRTSDGCKECERLSNSDVDPSSPFYPLYWFARQALGDKLASELLFDFQITEIVILAVCAYGYAVEGKMPPYAKDEPLRPLEFYEGLPVAPELEAQFYGKGLA